MERVQACSTYIKVERIIARARDDDDDTRGKSHKYASACTRKKSVTQKNAGRAGARGHVAFFCKKKSRRRHRNGKYFVDRALSGRPLSYLNLRVHK